MLAAARDSLAAAITVQYPWRAVPQPSLRCSHGELVTYTTATAIFAL
jgi:hypothetical protein